MKCINCENLAERVYHGFSFCDLHLSEYMKDLELIKPRRKK